MRKKATELKFREEMRIKMVQKWKSIGFAALYLAIPVILQFVIGIIFVMQLFVYMLVSGRPDVDVNQFTRIFEESPYNLIIVALLNLILIAGYGLWYYFIRKRRDGFPTSYRTILSAKSLFCTLGLAICSQFVANLIMLGFRFAFPKVFEEYVELAEGLSIDALPAALMIFIVAVWSPFAEELVFRAMIFRTLRKGFSFLPAAVISGVAFGVYHMNWVQGVYAGALGILLAYTYEKTDSLLGCYLFHFLFNLSSYGIEALQKIEWIPDIILGLLALACHIAAVVAIGFLIRAYSKIFSFCRRELLPSIGTAEEIQWHHSEAEEGDGHESI